MPESHPPSVMMMRKSTHTKDYALFLELLVETRRKAGLTQAQLGRRLPFSQPDISKMERGERRIDVVELRMICGQLGTELVDFVSALEARITEKDQ